MSHPSKIDILVRAKRAGFLIQLLFVGTDDPATNVDRVALRVAQGGHDVPEDRIVARWQRTMNLLRPALAESDVAYVFDNSATVPHMAGPRLVVHRQPSAFPNGHRVFPPVPAWVKRYALES